MDRRQYTFQVLNYICVHSWSVRHVNKIQRNKDRAAYNIQNFYVFTVGILVLTSIPSSYTVNGEQLDMEIVIIQGFASSNGLN